MAWEFIWKSGSLFRGVETPFKGVGIYLGEVQIHLGLVGTHWGSGNAFRREMEWITFYCDRSLDFFNMYFDKPTN